MNRGQTQIAAAVTIAAFAMSAGAAEFRSTAPITLTGGDSLHRVALPFEAYRDARPDLADVRIINAAGEPVPIALAGEPESTKESPPAIDLPVFPVTRVAAATTQVAGAEIAVRASDGTLVAVKPRGPLKTTTPRPAAYVLDASQLKPAVRALVLDWKTGPGTQIVTVRVEASDDLKTWSSVASSPVVRIESGGRALTQPRVEFPPLKAKYYRLTWQAPEFTLISARAEPEEAVKPPPRSVHRVSGIAGPKPDEYIYDLGARLPIQALRLVPADTNAVISATFFTREDEKSDWRVAAGAAFYRLRIEGAEVESPAMETRHAARYWMARLAPGSTASSAPAMEVQWRPAQLVFVTRGAAPYSIAFGRPEAKPALLPVSNLIPNYERLAELKLPEARVGAVVTGPPPTRWQAFVAQIDTRRAILWTILVAAVAVLSVMAWRLMRETNKRAPR